MFQCSCDFGKTNQTSNTGNIPLNACKDETLSIEP